MENDIYEFEHFIIKLCVDGILSNHIKQFLTALSVALDVLEP